MIFSISATHALRSAALLAARKPGEAMLGRDLAVVLGVPADYLAKVLGLLARAGVLTASRGVRGGYRLARPAEEIRLVEIVEPFEGKRLRPGCLLRPEEPCSDDAACSAHGAWAKVKKAYTGFLDTTTLADIRGGAAPAAGRAPGARRAARSAGKATEKRRASEQRRRARRRAEPPPSGFIPPRGRA